MTDLIKNNPFQHICVLIICFFIIEMLLMFFILKIIFFLDLFQASNSVVLGFHGQILEGSFTQHRFENIKNMLILSILSGYFFGLIFHSFFARLTFSSIAVSADTATDLIGYTDFDLPENDIRNIGVISDYIGDFFKNSYSNIFTLLSSLLISSFFVSLFGAIFGVIKGFDSLFLILLPFNLLGFGLIIYTLYNSLIKTSSYYTYVVCFFPFCFFSFTFIITLLTYKVKINLSYIYLLFAITVFSVLFFSFFWFFISPNSKRIKRLIEVNKFGVVSTISKGFNYSFLMSFILALILVCLVMYVFLAVGFEFNIFRDLYHLGMVAIMFLIMFIPIFPFVISSSAIDTVSGISQMFVYPQEKQNEISFTESVLSTFVAIFHLFQSVFFILLTPLFVFFLILLLIRRSLFLKLDFFSDFTLISYLKFSFDLNKVLKVFEITILNPEFISGLILGVVILFLMFGFIMKILVQNYSIVYKAAQNNFSNSEIWTGDQLPDYMSLQTKISQLANKYIRNFSIFLMLIMTPFSLLVGIPGLFGIIISFGIMSFIFSILFVIAGSLWCNAKRQFEQDETKLGSSEHVSLIMCDKLGDIFKDTLGPSAVELYKFMILIVSSNIGLVVYFYKFLEGL